MPQPRRAFVAVGSNPGHRCDNIRAAREMIAEIPLTCVSNSSKIYESEPAYETRQDAFANAVIEIKTELAPLVLLDELMKIEAELGRDRSKRPRPTVRAPSTGPAVDGRRDPRRQKAAPAASADRRSAILCWCRSRT